MTRKTGTLKLIRARLAACLAATPFALLSACGDSGGVPPELGTNNDRTGQVFWFNGYGVDPNQGNGLNWDQLDAGADDKGRQVLSFAAQWGDLGVDDNWFAWGLKDGTVRFRAPKGSAVTLWQGGSSADVASLKARFGAPGSDPVQIVTGRQDGSIHYYSGTGTNVGWRRLHDGGWGSPAKFLAVQWPDENTYNRKLRVVVALENGATEFYDGANWRELHDTGWNSDTTALSVHFSNEAYWPAVVQGLNNGAVVYTADNRDWKTLHNDTWASPVNKMKVQFPEENTQRYVKVVVGLADGAVEYYDGVGWHELWSSGFIKSQLGETSTTNGLCANFPTDNNSVDNVQVVQGLGNEAVLYYHRANSGGAGVSFLRGKHEDGDAAGIAEIQCSWEHGYLELLATITSAPIFYFNWQSALANGDYEGGWTSLAPYDVGENQFSFFSANFDGTSIFGTPRVAGGYRPVPKDRNIVKWLECKVCQAAVGSLVNKDPLECDTLCVTEVEAAGLGPEDPVADFVALACPFICKKVSDWFVGNVQDAAEDWVCDGVNMCKEK